MCFLSLFLLSGEKNEEKCKLVPWGNLRSSIFCCTFAAQLTIIRII